VREADVEAIGLLQDAQRRALYEYVVAQGRSVSRNEAAAAVGLQRTLAAFHLDRMATAGLLEITYKRLNNRSGPGAGRPAKLYSRPASERAVSLPPRDYARAANVLADAIERSGAEQTLYTAAQAHGVSDGAAIASLDDLHATLAERGYEPYATSTGLRLRNCPFHTLAQEFPVIACGMNLALLDGMLSGSGLAGTHTAQLAPRPGECCVTIEHRPPPPAAPPGATPAQPPRVRSAKGKAF
jgi:predicted ArsR family transcriptional regulator